MIIFLNGKYVCMKASEVSKLSPWNLNGRGVFETMRIEDGYILFFKEHMERLSRGLKRFNMKSRYTESSVKGLIKNLIKKNNFKFSKLRIVIWLQDGKQHISIVCNKIKAMPMEIERLKISANISDQVRSKTRYSHLKTIDYSYFYRAYLYAKNKNSSEAILLNCRGEIVEGSRMNIFFVKEGVLYTPYINCGCLNGITRNAVIKLARTLKLTIRRTIADKNCLLYSDEVFGTNSVRGIIPIVQIDNQLIAGGVVGPLTERIYKRYNEDRAKNLSKFY